MTEAGPSTRDRPGQLAARSCADVTVTSTAPHPSTWDDLVEASGSPLFYRADVVRAYQRYPLEDTLATFYLTLAEPGTGRAEAVLPAFLVPAGDPLGLLARLMPGFCPGGRPLLLSHCWHWYDTHVPARRLTAGTVRAVCAALGDLAASQDAQAFGFMNVAGGSRLADLLATAGHPTAPIDARYLLDLAPFGSVDDYLASLRSRARQEIRRHVRLAAGSGATVTVGEPTADDVRAAAQLCRVTAAKHGNPNWYDPARLTSFILSLRPHTRLVAIRVRGDLVAASISFVDGARFHNWAAGTVPLSRLRFSPYLVLLEATIRTALAERCNVLEGGRRNDSWKERLGLRRQPLVGCLAAVSAQREPS
jgi:Acetyltransferase (GNAT) domain